MDQSRKHTELSDSGRPPLILPQLMHAQPQLLGDDRFLLVWDYLMLIFGFVDHLVDLVAYGRAAKVHRAAGVLPIIEDICNRISRPAERYCRGLDVSRSSVIQRVLGWCGNVIGFKDPCDLRGTLAGKRQIEYPFYNSRRLDIRVPNFLILFILDIWLKYQKAVNPFLFYCFLS